MQVQKEIGGYFGLERFGGRELYGDLVAVNSARHALLYVLRARRVKKLYIPYFLCDSVSGICTREGVPYEYYHIDKNFRPVFEKTLGEGEYLYIVNYYGQIGDEELKALVARFGAVIFDNVQAFFARPVEGVDTVYSCRKFFGVPDGGYVATDARLDEPLPVDVSMHRMKHVLGRFEGVSASDYYDDFKTHEHTFADAELYAMSRLTHNLLRAVDYEDVKRRREENYAVLEKLLGARNALSLKAPEGPYAYPFYTENGMEIKRELAKQRIFVPTLWPDVPEGDTALEKDLAANILPLPCDQRYDAQDMAHMASALTSLL